MVSGTHDEATLILVQENQRAMERVFEELGRINTSLGQVREKMAAIEASSLHPQVAQNRHEISSLRERVAVLEGDKTARAHVAKTHGTIAEWGYRLAPWAFILAYVSYTSIIHH